MQQRVGAVPCLKFGTQPADNLVILGMQADRAAKLPDAPERRQHLPVCDARETARNFLKTAGLTDGGQQCDIHYRLGRNTF
ncbi:hypothetical protein KC345_g12173, partial [Hortaea werneckii]